MTNDPKKQGNDWTDEIMVTGNELVARIKKLVADGNVRRLIIRKPSGESLLEIPLTTGVAVGGTVTILAPVLAALGALAALLAEFRVEIVRTDGTDKHEE
jgi:hypothetical protein